MKLYIYQGLDDEKVPRDVTHVIVEKSVTVIKPAFHCLQHLVSIIMGDNVKRIEFGAFRSCYKIRFIRLSKTLEYIGPIAFKDCRSLEALFLPSTIKSIGYEAFSGCASFKVLILQNDIDLGTIGHISHRNTFGIIHKTNIQQIAENAGVAYEIDDNDGAFVIFDRRYGHKSNRRVNEWLIHHMDDAPFHKLCYDSSVTAKKINDYLNANGNASALAVDPHHRMTPLHMLSMSPYASVNSLVALLNANMAAAFCFDNRHKTPLDYAIAYNFEGLVAMMSVLCIHKNSLDPVPVPVPVPDPDPDPDPDPAPTNTDESLTNGENLKKRMRTE